MHGDPTGHISPERVCTQESPPPAGVDQTEEGRHRAEAPSSSLPSPVRRGQRGGGRQELRNKILRPFYWAFCRFQVRRDDHESYGHFWYHSNQHLHGYPIPITTQLITVGSAWGSGGVNIGSARRQLLAQHVQCVRSGIALTVHHRSSAATGAFAAACVSASSPLMRQ